MGEVNVKMGKTSPIEDHNRIKYISTRVVIAVDHDLFRQVLSLILEKAGIDVVCEAASGKEAVDATLQLKPDLLLLDIAMPEMDGLSVLSILKYLSPQTPVFIIAALADPLYMARAGELGVDGFYQTSHTGGTG